MIFCKMILKWLAVLSAIIAICCGIVGYFLYTQIASELPDVAVLQNVQYQTPFSVYSKDKALITQFGEKKRVPISIHKIPPQLIKAFLAAEDDRYYDHPGVDYKGIFRASLQLLATGKKKQGGSTITMQVTRNFLLTPEKTYKRKLKEIILALRIEQSFSKDEILELYLNQIYMGHRSYGIVAAAETYYGKSLNELTLAEQAMIAGLPKAPSSYNPITNPERAKERRDYILARMAELGYVSNKEATEAIAQADTAQIHTPATELYAPYIAEMVRQELIEKYGEDVYTSGFKVYTTITKELQETATRALRSTLHDFDKRHGYTAQTYQTLADESDFLNLPIIGDTYPAHILAVESGHATARLQNNSLIEIPTTRIHWVTARSNIVSATLKVNDIVRVRPLADNTWALAPAPKIEGAFVSLNPMTGAILALEGGFDFSRNKYNRATQSKRQPGSGFKPIIYASALEAGFTTSSVINDAPIIISSPGSPPWSPKNYDGRFHGPTRIRTALTYSRNIVAIRLLKDVGLDKVIDTAIRFGFRREQLPHGLSLALGSGYASPLEMASFYAILANGGFLVKPYVIERIEDHAGAVVFQANPKTACPLCTDIPPEINIPTANHATRVLSPQITFLMNSLLRDVVQYGTATAAKVLNRTDLAGKTGTTNDQKDAWFNGFTPTIAATAWVGYDSAKSLGGRETGGKAALPMWIEFMRTALKDIPEVPLTPPEGIVQANIDKSSGMIVESGGIKEYFVKDVYPKAYVYTGPDTGNASSEIRKTKTVESLF